MVVATCKMKSIVFSNNYKEIKKIICRKTGVIKYFILEEVKKIDEIRGFLSALQNCFEINKRELFDVKKERYNEEYIEFIAHLNRENNSFYWWGLNFPNKYPLFSTLAEKVINFLIIADFIENEKFDTLLIITEDRDIMVQLKQLKSDFRIVNRIESKLDLIKSTNEYIPMFITLAFVKAFLLRLFERCLFYFSFNRNAKYFVIRTIINHQSFDSGGGYVDAYFGKFTDYLNQQGLESIIFATVGRPYVPNFKKIKNQSRNLKIVPLEYHLSFGGLLKCLFGALNRYIFLFEIKGDSKINSKDVNYLIMQEIKKDCRTHRFFTNLLVYYCTKSLGKHISIERFFYPFENRAWEMLSLYALREGQNLTKIVGYQHSSITPMHLNFMLGDGEDTILPLPDLIVTIGEKTKKIMEESGRFPARILKVGCALRQGGVKELAPVARKGKAIKNILVVLASNLEEHVKALIFLNKVFSTCNSFDISIRPHPRFSIDEAVKLAAPIDFKFKVDNKPLNQSITQADVVLYLSSTVGIEALSLGIPVISMDLGGILNPDPIFDYRGLKWSVSKPEELLPTINCIESLSDEDYKNLQITAREYTQKYFYPVTEENLKQFITN